MSAKVCWGQPGSGKVHQGPALWSQQFGGWICQLLFVSTPAPFHAAGRRAFFVSGVTTKYLNFHAKIWCTFFFNILCAVFGPNFAFDFVCTRKNMSFVRCRFLRKVKLSSVGNWKKPKQNKYKCHSKLLHKSQNILSTNTWSLFLSFSYSNWWTF